MPDLSNGMRMNCQVLIRTSNGETYKTQSDRDFIVIKNGEHLLAKSYIKDFEALAKESIFSFGGLNIWGEEQVNKQYPHMIMFPYTSSGYGDWDNRYYATEQIISGKNSKVNNYKVVKIFEDRIEMYDYYLKILPEGKAKNNVLKWKASILSNSSYLAWKKNKGKKIAKAHPKKKEPKAENSTQIQASSGTAFFVDNKGHLITNYHVVEGCNNKSKISYNGKDINVNLKAKDRYLDLALLKADVNNDKYISFANDNPKKLERIIVAGYPFGKELSDDLKFTSGIITSLKGFMDDSTRLQIDAAINPGNSGGPIVYEKNGQLAGVAVSGLRKDKTEGMNFGIKTSSVQNFLESNQINISSMPQKFNFDNDDLASLLESATIYTYCN